MNNNCTEPALSNVSGKKIRASEQSQEGYATAYDVTGSALEYVADERELARGSYDINQVEEAAAAIDKYLCRRVEASIERRRGRPVVQLSGGVDSILLATYVAETAPDALAVTYSQRKGDPEARRASFVAKQYGLEHVTVCPSDEEFERLLARVVYALELPEPWEVSAGCVLAAIDDASRGRGAGGVLLSGAGADTLFMGGDPVVLAAGESLVDAWDSALRANVCKNFKRERFVPDFYERLIDDSERHVNVWQTHAAVELAQRIHPSLMQPADTNCDKYVLRKLAVDRGVPEKLAFAPKSPMQVSSGLVGAIVSAARRKLARDFGHRTYSSPLEESLEFIVARLYLQRL